MFPVNSVDKLLPTQTKYLNQRHGRSNCMRFKHMQKQSFTLYAGAHTAACSLCFVGNSALLGDDIFQIGPRREAMAGNRADKFFGECVVDFFSTRQLDAGTLVLAIDSTRRACRFVDEH